jgi:hypothetical protein
MPKAEAKYRLSSKAVRTAGGVLNQGGFVAKNGLLKKNIKPVDRGAGVL